ncbi:MAG: hypothetical protein JEY91_18570, partial [Spirochaetaceae bacterium]|nr:hypothetical protein [Spirochaetaceae bacterium]
DDIPFSSPENKRKLLLLLELYPDSNRAGCAVIYLSQMTEGEEREKYLKKAISSYSDCWFGNGVSVEAYAVYLMHLYYKSIGDFVEADIYKTQILNEFKFYYDHSYLYLGLLVNQN